MRITRREFLKFVAEGGVALGFLKLISLVPSQLQADIVRPPGAVKEEYFNNLCLRCGICLEVCPTRAIVMAGFEGGMVAANTPEIDPIVGPCEFYRGRCDKLMQCSEFCPTGALRQVPKDQVKMGTVELNPERCLAYMGKECAVCNEMCPVPEAITLTEDLKPVFYGDKCVGCGICVHYCPAEPKALTLRSKGAKRVRV